MSRANLNAKNLDDKHPVRLFESVASVAEINFHRFHQRGEESSVKSSKPNRKLWKRKNQT